MQRTLRFSKADGMLSQSTIQSLKTAHAVLSLIDEAESPSLLNDLLVIFRSTVATIPNGILGISSTGATTQGQPTLSGILEDGSLGTSAPVSSDC